MTADELFSNLMRGCQGHYTAIRSITKLQPSGGAGDKVFPPTYADSTYAFETRMIDGNKVETVLLDSVQSQANRFEEVLLDAYRSGRLALPMFEMNIAGHETVTSLTFRIACTTPFSGTRCGAASLSGTRRMANASFQPARGTRLPFLNLRRPCFYLGHGTRNRAPG